MKVQLIQVNQFKVTNRLFVLKKENRLKLPFCAAIAKSYGKCIFKTVLLCLKDYLILPQSLFIMFKIPDFILVSAALSDKIFIIACNFIRKIFLLIMQNVPLLKEVPPKEESFKELTFIVGDYLIEERLVVHPLSYKSYLEALYICNRLSNYYCALLVVQPDCVTSCHCKQIN